MNRLPEPTIEAAASLVEAHKRIVALRATQEELKAALRESSDMLVTAASGAPAHLSYKFEARAEFNRSLLSRLQSPEGT